MEFNVAPGGTQASSDRARCHVGARHEGAQFGRADRIGGLKIAPTYRSSCCEPSFNFRWPDSDRYCRMLNI